MFKFFPFKIVLGVSAANPLVLSESDLFSKFTRAVERKLPEEVMGRFSGEPEKSGLTMERSGSDIYAGKPRVRSIMSPEEEDEGKTFIADLVLLCY